MYSKFVRFAFYFVVLLAIGFGASASAADDTIKLLPSPLEFPTKIGSLESNGQPHKYDDPRLGKSYTYGAPGMFLTIYSYDAGVKEISDGGDTNATCEQFEEAKYGVPKAPDFKNVTLKNEQLVRLGSTEDSPLLREAVIELDRGDRHGISYIWITGAAKYFLKLRFTAVDDLRDQLPDIRQGILSTVATAIKPHLQPIDPNAKKSGNSINISMGGPESDMTDGFMYLTLLSLLTEKNPEHTPVCGGQYVPTYEEESGAYQGLLSFEEKGGSKLIKQLRDINKAGFFSEFVWVKLHRDEWGTTPPDNLKLAEFDIWQKKNLKKFKAPYFGTVGTGHPRPLPIIALQ